MRNTKLKTRIFGEIEVKEEDVIKFTKPILGFDDYRQYVLMEKDSVFPTFWLQSIDNPKLAFPVISPFSIDDTYSVKLSPHDFDEIHLKEIEDLLVLTLLVVPNDVSLIRTNLRAPIIYNPIKKLAKQLILQEEKYPIHFYINE